MSYESHHSITESSYLLRAVHRRGFGLSDMTIGDILTTQHPSYPVWDDMRVEVGQLRHSGVGTDPEYVAFMTSLYVRCFDNGEELQFATQIPHNYLEGSDLYVHAHWTPHTRGTAEAGKTVAWKVLYSASSISGVFPSVTTADLTDTCTGTNNLHEITASVTISGTGLGISSMIVGKVIRDAGDSWATNTAGNRPGLLEVDFHYQIDSRGSDSERTK